MDASAGMGRGNHRGASILMQGKKWGDEYYQQVADWYRAGGSRRVRSELGTGATMTSRVVLEARHRGFLAPSMRKSRSQGLPRTRGVGHGPVRAQSLTDEEWLAFGRWATSRGWTTASALRYLVRQAIAGESASA